MKNSLLKLASTVLFTLSALTVVAQASPAGQFQTIDLLGGTISLSAGQTRTVDLDGWRYVQKIYVQAEAYGRDAVFEVIANGDVKGTVHVPGYDPSYVVTIGETISSLELRQVSGNTVYIRDIKGVVSTQNWGHRPSDPGIEFPYLNEASELALQAIHAADSTSVYASLDDQMRYLQPVKVQAARAYAIANARGAASGKTRATLVALLAQLDFAKPYIEQLMSADATFEAAIQLLSIRERLEKLLD